MCEMSTYDDFDDNLMVDKMPPTVRQVLEALDHGQGEIAKTQLAMLL